MNKNQKENERRLKALRKSVKKGTKRSLWGAREIATVLDIEILDGRLKPSKTDHILIKEWTQERVRDIEQAHLIANYEETGR